MSLATMLPPFGLRPFGLRPFGLRRYKLATMALSPPPAFPPLPDGLSVKPFKAPDLQILGPQAMDPTMTEHRLTCGDRPWGLWRGRELLCYGWSSTRPTSILSLTMLVPAPGEAYLYGFFTPPAHRGKGYYPLLLRQISAQLGADGVTRAWIAVVAENRASWRGVLKAGFRKSSTYVSWHGRITWTVPEGSEPQPILRPRFRGLHFGTNGASGAVGARNRVLRPR